MNGNERTQEVRMHTGRIRRKKHFRWDRLCVVLGIIVMLSAFLDGIVKSCTKTENVTNVIMEEVTISKNSQLKARKLKPVMYEMTTEVAATGNETTEEYMQRFYKNTYEANHKVIYSSRLDRYVSDDEIYLLTMISCSEAGIEPLIGKIAVVATILNRVESEDFPNDIYSVIFEEGQFSSAHEGKFYSGWGSTLKELTMDTLYEDTLSEAREAVFAALNGEDPTYQVGGALFFYNPDYCSQEELEMRSTISNVVQIEDHVFYRIWD